MLGARYEKKFDCRLKKKQNQPPEVFHKKGVVQNFTKFTKFTKKHLCQSLFFDKVADLRLFVRTPLRAASVKYV